MLENICLSIRHGQTLALVGPSGGGKTTLCHLLPRFYDITSGSITVDGIDIRDVTLSSLRRNIGIVQQDVFLLPRASKKTFVTAESMQPMKKSCRQPLRRKFTTIS